jgi:hypothetical protein
MEIFYGRKNVCVKILGECVFHYPLAHYALAVPQGPGPPLHVERSSSGHFPPPRTPESGKHAYEDCNIDNDPTISSSSIAARLPTHPPPPQRKPKGLKIKFYRFYGGVGGWGGYRFYNFIDIL